MASNIVYQNGLFLEESRVKIALCDSSFLWGLGFFETLRVTQGIPLFLEEHTDRLLEGLKAAHLVAPVSKARLKFLVYETLGLNHLKEAVLRIWVSYEAPRLGEMSLKNFRPSLIISCKPFEPFPSSLYEEGLSCLLVEDLVAGCSPLPTFKTTNYLASMLAKQQAYARGYEEALLKNASGNICEGATSNIFCIFKDKLSTPPLSDGVLAGITRQKVLGFARRSDLKVVEESLKLEELLMAEEVFLTSSLKGVIPVSNLNEEKLARKNKHLPKLMELYQEEIQSYVEQALAGQFTHPEE